MWQITPFYKKRTFLKEEGLVAEVEKVKKQTGKTRKECIILHISFLSW